MAKKITEINKYTPLVFSCPQATSTWK